MNGRVSGPGPPRTVPSPYLQRGCRAELYSPDTTVSVPGTATPVSSKEPHGNPQTDTVVRSTFRPVAHAHGVYGEDVLISKTTVYQPLRPAS